MTRLLRFAAPLLPLVALTLQLSAQVLPDTHPAVQSQAPLRFEVISIRPHKFTGDDPSNRKLLPGGRFVVTATTVRTFIRIACGTDDERMIGAPGWIDNESFDIDAITADHAEVKTPAQLQQLVLSLLQERFGFKFHREQKEGSVYWLELNKAGKTALGLRLADASEGANMSTSSNGPRATMKVTNQSMADVAAALRRQAGRPVEDHTGLSGKYDFQIEWAPKDTADSTMPSLYAVLQEQLGLRLRPAKGAIEMIVIDHVEQPSDN
jgi:uncharacterized protein (TIGR03435 family)